MTLETALQIAYVVLLLAFGLREWQMRRRVRTLSRRVRALLDLEHERLEARLEDSEWDPTTDVPGPEIQREAWDPERYR